MSQNFGEKLRARRIEKGHTLESLANAVDSTKAYVWQLENKKPAKPSGALLIRLANVLDISAEYLIDDSSKEPNEKHVGVALARGAQNRHLSQKDIDRLFRIADSIGNDRANKTGK